MNWLSNFWFNYEWPSLKGNGPEAITQTLIYGIIAIALVPPIRRWFKGEYDKLHARIDHTHQRIDHIIAYHPDIPPFVPKKEGVDTPSG